MASSSISRRSAAASAALHVPSLALRRPSLPPWIGKAGWAVVSIGMFCAI